LIHSGKGFKHAKDNLIHRAQLYIKATQKFIEGQGFLNVDVDGLIVGVNPGFHVETHRSAVRVIQSDAIRRFGSQWNQDQPILSPEQIYQITAKIVRIGSPAPDPEKDLRKAIRSEPKDDKFVQSLEPLQKTFNFSASQWAFLGILVFGTVIVLLALITYLMISLP